jgi:hypothetical protein
MPHARGLQQPVNLRRADRQKFFLNCCGQRRLMPLVMFEPFAQRRLEQLAALLVAGQPDRLEDGQQPSAFSVCWCAGAQLAALPRGESFTRFYARQREIPHFPDFTTL